MMKKKVGAFFFCLIWLNAGLPFGTAAAGLAVVARDPYASAILVDHATGKVLFEDRADIPVYPASITKLMTLLILLERVEDNLLDLSEKVRVSADVSKIGGTQVWLKEGEIFTVDELMYAMMIRSANDAAAALAKHVAGTCDNFLALMNERARQLGMASTCYASVHGLPPGPGQKPDVTTASDQAILAMELAKHPTAFRYTSVRKRDFRPDVPMGKGLVEMINHNPLLGEVEGCDGFKTGYFGAAGFSIVATAERKGRRLTAVVMGSKTKESRNAKAKELIGRGFLELPRVPDVVGESSVITNAGAAIVTPRTRPFWSTKRLVFAVLAGVAVVWVVAAFIQRGSRPRHYY